MSFNSTISNHKDFQLIKVRLADHEELVADPLDSDHVYIHNPTTGRIDKFDVRSQTVITSLHSYVGAVKSGWKSELYVYNGGLFLFLMDPDVYSPRTDRHIYTVIKLDEKTGLPTDYRFESNELDDFRYRQPSRHGFVTDAGLLWLTIRNNSFVVLDLLATSYDDRIKFTGEVATLFPSPSAILSYDPVSNRAATTSERGDMFAVSRIIGFKKETGDYETDARFQRRIDSRYFDVAGAPFALRSDYRIVTVSHGSKTGERQPNTSLLVEIKGEEPSEALKEEYGGRYDTNPSTTLSVTALDTDVESIRHIVAVGSDYIVVGIRE